MKKNILFLFLIVTYVTEAQNFAWLKNPPITITTDPRSVSYPVTVDNNGNSFICGYQNTPTYFTDTFSNLIFCKYDTLGNLVFDKVISGNAHVYKMAVDSQNNLYMAVSYLTSISIDNLMLTANQLDEHPILLKFDNNGNFLWHKAIAIPSIDFFRAITISENDMVYLGYDNYLNSYIEKIDSAGNSLQLITQTGVKLLSSVAVDNQGNIYAAGSCAEFNGNYNGTNGPTDFLYNTYVVKYNPQGEMQWLHHVEDVTCIEPKVVAKSPDEVYFSSYLFGNYQFGDIVTEGPENSGFGDFFLARLNQDGDFLWVKEIPGSGSIELANRDYLVIDNQGFVYLYGNITGTTIWNSSITTQSQSTSADVCILKYNQEGDLIWAKSAGGNSEDHAQSMAVNKSDNPEIILSSISIGTVVFDSYTISSVSQNYYPVLAKLNNSSLENPENTTEKIVIFPNPFDTILQLSFPDNSQRSVIINDSYGKLLYSNTTSDSSIQIESSGWSSGIYFVSVVKNNSKNIVKLIKS